MAISDFTSMIRSKLEHSSVVWNSGITQDEREDLERIQDHESFKVNFAHRIRYQNSAIPSMQIMLNNDEKLKKKKIRTFGC